MCLYDTMLTCVRCIDANLVLPLEFSLLGYNHPEKWDLADGLIFSYLMALDMSRSSASFERRRWELLHKKGKTLADVERLKPPMGGPPIVDDAHVTALMQTDAYRNAPFVDPIGPLYESTSPEGREETEDKAETTRGWSGVVTRLWGRVKDAVRTRVALASAQEIRATLGLRGHDGKVPPQRHRFASNSWAVGGNLTASGGGFVANDPHLSLTSPMVWMLMKLESPDTHIVGASVPGLPLVGIGRSNDIGWGITSGATDAWDYFVLEQDNGGFKYRGEQRQFVRRVEKIKVKGGDTVELEVRMTPLGPVMNDGEDIPSDELWTARWPALDGPNAFVESLYVIAKAKTLAEAEASGPLFVSPTFNIVVADPGGHISYMLIGKQPVRASNQTGSFPTPGDGYNNWQGYIPWARMPKIMSSTNGYIVTANQVVAAPSYPYDLGNLGNFAEPYRATRIHQLLHPVGSVGGASATSMVPVQLDVVSLAAVALRDTLQAMSPQTADGVQWRDKLVAWIAAGAHTIGSSREATMFTLWWQKLEDELLESTQSDDIEFMYVLNTISPPSAASNTDPACTFYAPNCLSFAAGALDRAAKPFGATPPPLHDIQHVHYKNRLQSGINGIPLLRCLLSRSTPSSGGDDWTVAVQHGGFHGSGSGITRSITAASSYRHLIDMNGDSLWSLPLGNSGNPFSQYFHNWLHDFIDGKFMPLPWPH
mmetsp:Transcript_44164/g.95806  ORF Transcript_44164/g.95806 Transcript_44164/m.95806 type:complete len:709 (-) Transcript_44164:827-2953(-)